MAITEIRTTASSLSTPESTPGIPRIQTAIATGVKALETVGRVKNAVKNRFSKTTDHTESALSFLPRRERAEVWARFGNLNAQDAEAVAPVRKVSEEARVNKSFTKWFVETALVNSRHRQGQPYRRRLEFQPDGPEKVSKYLRRVKPTLDEEILESDVYLERAARVFEEKVDVGELDPMEARTEMERFAEEHRDARVTMHLAVLADRRANDVVQRKRRAEQDSQGSKIMDSQIGTDSEVIGSTGTSVEEVVFSR